MFIPLTINQRRENGELKNIAIAGDTAGIFWVLSQLTKYDLNIFLADTGIKKPLRDFPSISGKGDHETERCNVYYDFFEGKIGEGIYRRMDAVILTESISEDLEMLEALGVPTVQVRMTKTGVEWLDLVGLTVIGEDIRINRPTGDHVKVLELTGSAWDRCCDLIGNTEQLEYGPWIFQTDERKRLIELGVPELAIVQKRHMDGTVELTELTGDLYKVFDGLFEK